MAERDAPGLLSRVRQRLAPTPLGVAKRRLLRQPVWPWSRIEDVEGEPNLLSDWRFFAVLGTWNEEDVIESCVRNAITQGCEQVFLVDNASDDQTVQRAVAAGAVVARTYATQEYDESLRIRLMQEVVESVSRQSGAAHVWWLWLYADEFPHGRSGLTLHQQLAGLDRRFRVVGARWLNHYPSGAPQSRRGRHPLDYQPLAEDIVEKWYCECGHWKHPLQRWDLDGPKIVSWKGAHYANSRVTLVEPRDPAIIHHFPFRDEMATRARFAKLYGDAVGLTASRGIASAPFTEHRHMKARYKSIDAVYRQEWGDIVDFRTETKGVSPRPWTQLVEAADTVVERWYDGGR